MSVPAHIPVRDDDPEGDWTEPGAYHCAEGVHRVPLPLPQDGLRAVNVYVVATADGPVLVDAGWSIPEARELLAGALDALGWGLRDVRRFLVTHVHRDHYTQAVALRSEFGTPVALGVGERASLAHAQDPANVPIGPQLDGLLRAGAPDVRAAIEPFLPGERDVAVWSDPDEWLDDGSTIAVGDRKLTALATPGHTRGHLVFSDEPGGLLFAGDHVLPRITPSIGFEAEPGRRPLAAFLDSLALLKTMPDARLLPAHGPVGMAVHERVDELLDHHIQRLDATLAGVGEGRTTAAEVAATLGWTRRGRRLSELDPFNAMLAVLETMAHLELLVERGVLHRTTDGDVAHYTV